MEDSKFLIFSSKFQWTLERIYLKFMYNLCTIYVQFGHAPSKDFASPDLGQVDKNKIILVHSFGSKRSVNFATASTAIQSRTSDLLE